MPVVSVGLMRIMKIGILLTVPALAFAVFAITMLTSARADVRFAFSNDQNNLLPTSTPRKKNGNKPDPMSNTSPRSKLKPVEPGAWGGRGVAMTIEKTGVQIGFECADGEISEALMADENGKFSINGVFIRRGPGPLREDRPPERLAVRYQGSISGEKMSLKVTRPSDDGLIGEYSLERDKFVRLHRCL